MKTSVTTEGSLALTTRRRERASHTTPHEPAADLPALDPRRKAQADAIKRRYCEGIVGIVGAGIMVRDVKEEILAAAGTEKVEGYREFRQFCEADLQWPKSQVNRLIDVANAFGAHLDLVDRFDLSALYSLSRATPDKLEQALERARGGEFVSNKDAAELIHPARAASSKGTGKGAGKNSRASKDYSIPIPDGTVVVAAPHRTLAEVRVALQVALEVIDARIAKRRRTPAVPSGEAVTTL
jgi:hypothetical protein